MRNKFVYIIGTILLGCGLSNLGCKHSPKTGPETNSSNPIEDLEKEKVLEIAEYLALKEYGNIIKNELPLRAQLVGDSIWVVQGTLPKGADGGTVYIELRKGNNELIRITHYK